MYQGCLSAPEPDGCKPDNLVWVLQRTNNYWFLGGFSNLYCGGLSNSLERAMQDRVVGTTMPVLELSLDPGESVISETGELSWKTPNVSMTTATGMAGGKGFFGKVKQMAGGGSLFMTKYLAEQAQGTIAFAARLPGQLFPIDVTPQPGGGYLASRHSFICATDGVELSIGFQQKLGVGFFGGEGFILQRISAQGKAWVSLSGEIVTYDLQPGQTIQVHPGHIGLMQDTVQFSLTTVPGLKNKFFGGDGIFLTQLSGPGRVWLQSMTLDRLAHALLPYLPSGKSPATAVVAWVASLAGCSITANSRRYPQTTRIALGMQVRVAGARPICSPSRSKRSGLSSSGVILTSRPRMNSTSPRDRCVPR